LRMTGSRIAKAAHKYLGDAEHFAVTYGDGVTDVDLKAEFAFHCDQKRIGTILAVNPPSRFGELKTKGNIVEEFAEKPEFQDKWINGGYFFFRRDFVRYVETTESCVLERQPLAALARDGELAMYRHEGFWAAMDTQRERDYLNEIWAKGNAPWAVGQTSTPAVKAP
jgi:glucose-1-phosphate cytidylyltransferase